MSDVTFPATIYNPISLLRALAKHAEQGDTVSFAGLDIAQLQRTADVVEHVLTHGPYRLTAELSALPCYADDDAQAVEILLASLPPLPAKRSWWRRLFGTAQREDME